MAKHPPLRKPDITPPERNQSPFDAPESVEEVDSESNHRADTKIEPSGAVERFGRRLSPRGSRFGLAQGLLAIYITFVALAYVVDLFLEPTRANQELFSRIMFIPGVVVGWLFAKQQRE